MPNPSHLEFVNPVLEGVARALQRTNGARDESSVLPVVVHGDAAFPGEGVVAETLNLSRLRGYRVGGTLHIIVPDILIHGPAHDYDFSAFNPRLVGAFAAGIWLCFSRNIIGCLLTGMVGYSLARLFL